MPFEGLFVLVEPRDSVRQALVQAIKAEKMITKALPIATPQEALKYLRAGHTTDVIFISNTFSEADTLRFVSAAKNCKAGRDAAFILLMGKTNQSSVAVAKQILKGMDGFLNYPFTIETVQAIVSIAMEVKNQRLRTRVELASKMIVSGVMDHIDYTSFDASEGRRQLCVSEELKNSAEVLRSFDEEELVVYYDVLSKMMAQATPPVKFVNFSSDSIPRCLDNPEIDAILQGLNSSSYRERLGALERAAEKIEEMIPYSETIKKLTKDSTAICRRRASSLLTRMEDCHPSGSHGNN